MRFAAVFFGVVLVLCVFASGVLTARAAAPARFHVSIDTSGARAVLAAATTDPDHAPALADIALANPAVQAMIAKMARYDPTVTPERFRAAIISEAAGGSGSPFDLDRLRKDPEPTRRMLDRLDHDNAEIARRMAERLGSFTPDGMTVNAEMHVLVGASHQNGWVPGVTPNFYVDLGFHGEEVDSLVNVADHELFHVIQGMANGWEALQEDKPDLPVDARERHRARQLLANLVEEGTATYVGDPLLYSNAGPHLARDQREVTRYLDRAPQTFALFETMLYRARHDPDAPIDDLDALTCAGSWNQTCYYMGYRMTKAIDRYEGRGRLRELLRKPPEVFVADYIALSHAHPDDPEITPLAKATEEIVAELVDKP